jgi:hypothetical protein
MKRAEGIAAARRRPSSNGTRASCRSRGEILGDVRPAFMLQIVTQLIKPEVLVEVEIIAAAK